MKSFFIEYKYSIIGGLIGLILAVLLFSLGFIKTIIVLALTIAGVFLGSYLKHSDFLEKFFSN